MRNGTMPVWNMMTITAAACLAVTLGAQPASAQESRIIKTDAQIDALDPGIRLFVLFEKNRLQFFEEVLKFLKQ